MESMILFSKEFLTALADFLEREPITYLYGMVLFLFIAKVFKIFIVKE